MISSEIEEFEAKRRITFEASIETRVYEFVYFKEIGW